MTLLNKTVIASLITFTLTGCFEANVVEVVKDTVFSTIDPTLKLGNALDTRNVCMDTKWVISVDARKRQVVDYTCQLTKFTPIFSKWNDDEIEQFKLQTQEQIKQLLLDNKNAKTQIEVYKKYLRFVDRMEKQNVIAALALVKKNTPEISTISRFAFEPDENRLKEIAIPSEVAESFRIASKLYTDELNSRDYGADFTFPPQFFDLRLPNNAGPVEDINSFELIIDGVIKGQTTLEAINAQKSVIETMIAETGKMATTIQSLEHQITKESLLYKRQMMEADQPTKIVQHIVFAPTEEKPVLLTCELDFYTPNSKDKVALKKTIDSATTCLTESYKPDYTAFYTSMFADVYAEQKK